MTAAAPAPRRTADAARWLGVFLQCALLGALVFQAAMSLVKLAMDVAYPYPLDYGEGIVLDRALALARGEALYLPMDRPPYASWNFPPLYAWVCALGVRFTDPSFVFGRVVSVVAIAVTTGCVYLLARRHIETNGIPGHRRWAVVAALLYVGSPALLRWGALMRVDSLGLALGLAGYTAIVYGASPVLAGVLFAAALLCKQSMVAGILAACFALAAAQQWRRLLVTSSTCLLLVSAVLLWQHTVAGGWLWRHLITCNANAWTLEQFRSVLGLVLVSHLLLLALALADLLAGAVGVRPSEHGPAASSRLSLNPGHFYLAGALVVALLSGKVGAEVNHLLDLVAALCVVGASSAARGGTLIERHASPGPGLALASALLCVHAWSSFAYPPIRDRLSQEAVLRSVTRALAQARGPVIAEEPGLAPISGKPLWLQPFEFTQMAEAGRWDQGPLVAALAQARFPVIVLRFDPWDQSRRNPNGTWEGGRFTDDMVSAIRSAYIISELPGGTELGTWVILRPAGKGHRISPQQAAPDRPNLRADTQCTSPQPPCRHIAEPAHSARRALCALQAAIALPAR